MKEKSTKKKLFNILAIESSCDETSSSVMDEEGRVLSNIVLSQDKIHAPYGGIVPELASRQHIKSINYVVEESLCRSKSNLADIDYFAVTQGPGLIGSLLVGLSFAKGLAYYYKKPLIPIDHLEAHIHSVLIENSEIPFPALALLVSGGHTSIYLMKNKMNCIPVAKTRDDAAGEALDKIAKYLNLGYPGGPVIDKMAARGKKGTFHFALPKMTDKSLDFSFSGIKTAALRIINENDLSKEETTMNDFLADFQHIIVQALLVNLKKFIAHYSPYSLILSGGVACNTTLRSEFKKLAMSNKLECYIPSPDYCTDNAAMVARLALEKIGNKDIPASYLNFNAYARKKN